MEIKIALLVFLSVLYVVESFHDYNVWKASSNNNYYYTKQWHKWDFVFHIMIGILISYLMEGFSLKAIHLLLNIGLLRFLVLNISLNLLRRKKWYYLSNDSNFIDKLLKKVERESMVFAIIINLFSWTLYII